MVGVGEKQATTSMAVGERCVLGVACASTCCPNWREGGKLGVRSAPLAWRDGWWSERQWLAMELSRALHDGG